MSRTVDDAAEIFQAWLDGRRYVEGPGGMTSDERSLVEQAQGSDARLEPSNRLFLGLPPDTTVGEAAELLLAKGGESRLRNVKAVNAPSVDAKIIEAGYGPAVVRLMELLAEAVGRTTIALQASWKLLNDREGRPVLWLVLSDDLVRVVASFDPRLVFSGTADARHQIHRLWRDLLQMRSHKLIEEMKVNAMTAESP